MKLSSQDGVRKEKIRMEQDMQAISDTSYQLLDVQLVLPQTREKSIFSFGSVSLGRPGDRTQSRHRVETLSTE